MKVHLLTPQWRYGTMSGWRFAGLFAYYVLLSALAALFAAALATAANLDLARLDNNEYEWILSVALSDVR
jgi:hypothetical protein